MSAADHPALPCDVFGVVRATGGPLGHRQHRVHSALYETRAQAHLRLLRLRTTNVGGELSIWKFSTYVEPAVWCHDVVLSDGTLIRPAKRAGSSRGNQEKFG